jgi:hypothetical protein
MVLKAQLFFFHFCHNYIFVFDCISANVLRFMPFFGFPDHPFVRLVEARHCVLPILVIHHHAHTVSFVRCGPTSPRTSPFLDVEGRKAGAATAGSLCILSIFQVCFIVWRICLVGVKAWSHCQRSWALHESCICFSVSGVSPHDVRRVLHVRSQLSIRGWASVVRPSCVTIEEPSIVSSHSSDFRCI